LDKLNKITRIDAVGIVGCVRRDGLRCCRWSSVQCICLGMCAERSSKQFLCIAGVKCSSRFFLQFLVTGYLWYTHDVMQFYKGFLRTGVLVFCFTVDC
jgi:hypothetical protein